MNDIDSPGCMHGFVAVQMISTFLPPAFISLRRQWEHFSKAVLGLRRAVNEHWISVEIMRG